MYLYKCFQKSARYKKTPYKTCTQLIFENFHHCKPTYLWKYLHMSSLLKSTIWKIYTSDFWVFPPVQADVSMQTSSQVSSLLKNTIHNNYTADFWKFPPMQAFIFMQIYSQSSSLLITPYKRITHLTFEIFHQCKPTYVCTYSQKAARYWKHHINEV